MIDELCCEFVKEIAGELTVRNNKVLITKSEWIQLRANLHEIRRFALPENTIELLNCKIAAIEHQLKHFFPQENLCELKDLFRFEDEIFDYRQAYLFAKDNRATYSDETECTIAFFRQAQSTEVAHKIESKMLPIYRQLSNEVRHLRGIFVILDEYIELCRQRYSFYQMNAHWFIGFGLNGFM